VSSKPTKRQPRRDRVASRQDPRHSNSPVVELENGEEVNVEEWDPMPENLQRADRIDPTKTDRAKLEEALKKHNVSVAVP